MHQRRSAKFAYRATAPASRDRQPAPALRSVSTAARTAGSDSSPSGTCSRRIATHAATRWRNASWRTAIPMSVMSSRNALVTSAISASRRESGSNRLSDAARLVARWCGWALGAEALPEVQRR